MSAPPQYLSAETNNPNKNQSFYFICPIALEYKLGVKHGKEMYKGLQEWKKHIRNNIANAIMNHGLDGLDAKDKEHKAIEALELSRNTEKNKAIINPAYDEWLKEKPEKVSKAKTSVGDLAIANQQLKKEKDEMEAKMEFAENMVNLLNDKMFDLNVKLAESKEVEIIDQSQEVNDLKSRIGRRDETINELKAAITDYKEQQKVSFKDAKESGREIGKLEKEIDELKEHHETNDELDEMKSYLEYLKKENEELKKNQKPPRKTKEKKAAE